jgi:predicted ribosome quality control (RQC) complex YloA/Tae2 family protein
LASPEADPKTAGFILKRPRSYYLAEDVDRDKRGLLQSVAVDGDAVLEIAMQPWPGCALPWKVRSISANGLKRVVRVGHPPALIAIEEKVQKRRRKGKKARIALRKKLQATKNKQQQQAILAKEKEEADREKKTRRNREKKLKKKAREKAKKGAIGGEGDGGESEATEAD